LTSACAGGSEQVILRDFFAASRLRDLTALQNIATVSLDPSTQGIVTTFRILSVSPERRDGQSAAKDVVVSAPVRLPGGETVEKTFTVTLTESGAETSDRSAKALAERHPRWIVTGVTGLPTRVPGGRT